MRKGCITIILIALFLSNPAWAEKGDFLNEFQKGLTAFNRGHYKTASQFLRPLAEQGVVDAQLKLGVMYGKGRGVKMNKIQAFVWWMKAARQGNQEAQSNLDILCKESPWACK